MRVQDLISKLDFVELVNRNTALKPAGGNKFKGLSPFTNEKTPSFYVDAHSKVWTCFSSGTGGGVLDYISKIEGLTPQESYTFLREYLGIEEAEETNPVQKALNLAHSWFMKEQGVAEKYMLGRGFTSGVAQRYKLGYVGNGYSLINYLKAQGLTEDSLKEASLLTERGKPFFFNRVMVPIYNTYNRLVGFTGRKTEDDGMGPKYLHSSNLQKSKILWNLPVARKSKSEFLIACEGTMDAIALTENGFPAVAILGAAISEEQLQHLSRVAPQIYTIYDDDEAGDRGLLRTHDMVVKLDLDSVVYSLILPGGDPEDYLRTHTPDDLREVMNGAKSDTTAIVQALIREQVESIDQSKSKVYISRQVLQRLSPYMTRQLSYRSLDLVERVAQEFSLSRSELQKHLTAPFRYDHYGRSFTSTAFPAPVYERRILVALIDEPHLLKELHKNEIYSTDFFSHMVTKVVSLIKPEYSSSEVFDVIREKLGEEEYFQILEMYTIGVPHVDFQTSLEVLKGKIRMREAELDTHNADFIGRPMTHTEKDSKTTIKDLLGYGWRTR